VNPPRRGTHSYLKIIRAIEDNILLSCADLVQNCVVVGHYKPGIILLVEPTMTDPTDEIAVSELKSMILERHAPFNSRLFAHERLQQLYQIVPVPRNKLPRTMVRVALILSNF